MNWKIMKSILDVLDDVKLTPHNRKYLHVARENADNLLNLVNELLEFRRTDTGNSKLRSEPIELNGFMDQLAAQFECVSEQRGVHFYHQIPDDQLNIWVDKKKFTRMRNKWQLKLVLMDLGGLVGWCFGPFRNEMMLKSLL